MWNALSYTENSLKETYHGVFTTSKHSIWIPENMFLKLFAGNSF
jgi:hypothetical protein